MIHITDPHSSGLARSVPTCLFPADIEEITASRERQRNDSQSAREAAEDAALSDAAAAALARKRELSAARVARFRAREREKKHNEGTDNSTM